MRGGEESAHRSRLHRAEEDGALDAEVVEHRPNVVHPSLERRRLARPVGELHTVGRALLVPVYGR
jgi:hypothetical protein